MEKQRAQEILDNFMGKRVLVVGDVMLDEYVWGKVSRISPEAPVMVVDADRETHVPGGAANVVNNLCALGAVASITGVIGQDSAGAILAEKLREEGALTDGLLTVPLRPTTRKTRIIAHSQQVVRVDHERRDPIDADTQKAVLAHLETAIPQCDALLLSDYQKGLLGRDLIAAAVDQARALGKIVTGNLKPQGIGSHCRLTVITLNLSEASAATGFILNEDSSAGQLHDAGRMLLRKSGAEYILITRGAQGLTLFGADGSEAHVPAHPVEVYDVAGAGDSVISTLTLALAAGATPTEAITLANCAGAVVVRKVGVATASRDEILATVSPED
jgi:rfaE bifunctional protein kinase chain/domain